MTILVVAAGGAFGAVSRYLASGWVESFAGSAFPWGTMAVNVVGSLALGFALVWLQGATSSAYARELIAVGFLGSFTTFSTFSYETLELIRTGEWSRAAGYTAGSVLLGLLAVAAGAAIAVALTQSARA